jgi:hypothetical protein
MTRVMLLGSLMIAVLPAAAAADQTCKPVVGHFEASVLPPDQCAGILCTAGRVWGGVQGTYQFVMTSLQPSGAVPSIMFFTGDSTIALKSGDTVLGIDTGSIDLGPNGGFASLITFNGGTGSHANASGQIRLRGELSQADGTTIGDYLGTICAP